MDRFTVRLNAEAENDILNSYDWGVRNWGEAAAERWIRQVYEAIFERLSVFPNRFPIAPDADLPEREIRHMILDRYRVLFEIRNSEVVILHFRGPSANS